MLTKNMWRIIEKNVNKKYVENHLSISGKLLCKYDLIKRNESDVRNIDCSLFYHIIFPC